MRILREISKKLFLIWQEELINEDIVDDVQEANENDSDAEKNSPSDVSLVTLYNVVE